MNREYLAHNIKVLCAYNQVKLKDLSTKVTYNEYRLADIVANKPIRVTEQEVTDIANYFNIPVDSLLNKKVHLEFK